ncbi:MAG: histidine kinase [Anaerolineaceae bacterium]|nr:histidine kinase [Anaerolineaceae bacterium]
MNLVSDILEHKGSEVWSLTPQTTVLEALKSLEEFNVGALLVVNGEKILGVVSERDIVRQLAKSEKCSLDQPVSLWMTSDVIVVPPSMSINECMQLMSKAHIRHLPVVEEGHLLGMISIGDVVRAVINDQQSTITSLENYILSQTIIN